MVAEFWPGWFDHWGQQHHKMEVEKVAKRVSNILKAGASINFYMFHGMEPLMQVLEYKYVTKKCVIIVSPIHTGGFLHRRLKDGAFLHSLWLRGKKEILAGATGI